MKVIQVETSEWISLRPGVRQTSGRIIATEEGPRFVTDLREIPEWELPAKEPEQYMRSIFRRLDTGHLQQ